MRDVVKTNFNNYNSNQRNSQGTRRKKRRKNLSLYYFTVFLFMVIALVVLSLTVFFNITEITISGNTNYTDDEIYKAANVKIGDNLYIKNKDKIEENILNNLVFIEAVTIKRSLPSTLIIELTPCIATANVEINGEYLLISQNGKILENKLSSPRGEYLTVKGLEVDNSNISTVLTSKDEHKLKILTSLLSEISTLELDKINEINITDRLNITMEYDNRISIELGSSLDLTYKITFVKEIITENTVPTFEGTIISRGNSEASLIKKEDLASRISTNESENAEEISQIG